MFKAMTDPMRSSCLSALRIRFLFLQIYTAYAPTYSKQVYFAILLHQIQKVTLSRSSFKEVFTKRADINIIQEMRKILV